MAYSRPDKTNYYLDIAQAVAKRGTCLRRNYGVYNTTLFRQIPMRGGRV